MIHSKNRYLLTEYGRNGEVWPKPEDATYVEPVAGQKVAFDVTFASGTQSVSWNGAQVLNGSVAQDVNVGDTLRVFSSSHWRYRSAARCYGLKIWEGTKLVRDLKPCVYNGTGALYDEVTKCVYSPSPAIPLSNVGPVVVPEEDLPARRLEYVESDGTVFVDTGILGNLGTSARMKLAFLAKADTGFLESRKGGNRYYLIHNGNAQPLIGFGGYYYVPASKGPAISKGDIFQMTLGQPYEIFSSLDNGAQRVDIDGVQYLEDSKTGATNTDLNLYIFTCNYDNVPMYHSKARLYGLKIYQDGKKVRDFAPVRLKNSGTVVLWDFVSKRAFPAQSVNDPTKTVPFPAYGDAVGPAFYGMALIIR